MNEKNMKPDELEQVCGGYDLTKANDYHHDLEIFIQVATKKLDALDMSTPEGIEKAQWVKQAMDEHVLEIIRECQEKTGILLPNPLLTA